MRRFNPLFLGLALSLLCPLAHADSLLFSFTETGGTSFFNGPVGDYTVSFVLPSSPAPVGELPGLLTFIGPVDVTLNGTLFPDEQLSFGSDTPTFGGVMGRCSPSSSTCPAFGGGFVLVSDALFTGTTAHPLFQPETYRIFDSQFDNVGLIFGGTQTLVISQLAAPTPEPSSLLLLGTGALGCFALKRRLPSDQGAGSRPMR